MSKEFLDMINSISRSVFGEDFQPKTIIMAETTKDKPNMDMFMLQLLNHFADFCNNEMVWEKCFKHKADGQHYRITIRLSNDA